ncbi:glucan biosynthesis protein [soil metagenome]
MSDSRRRSYPRLTRRAILSGAAVTATAFVLPEGPAFTATATTNGKAVAVPAPAAAASPFTRAAVLDAARKLAKAPFAAPPTDLPGTLKNLSYEEYRDIQFRNTAEIWGDSDVPFRLQMFHRGFYFKEDIEIAIVNDDKAEHLAYSPNYYRFGERVPRPLPTEDIGFAGIRLIGRINGQGNSNNPQDFGEVAVFQGASYFRSIGRNQIYGLSARGLAVKTAEPEGEEFPLFRQYWIEKPDHGAESIVVHALLDSQSVTGAYRFTIRPGTQTTMDVEVTLFPRTDLKKFGIGPASSMYMFGPNGRNGVDDYRPEVHDSDGLLMVNGKGERLWRPLSNPKTLQISAFQDTRPRGFGLSQRERSFAAYQDIEANYERRPTLWVEPVGDWGDGAVTLIEIPSDSEINDNIVAYWAPKDPIKAGTEYSLAYRLLWGTGSVPERTTARIVGTRLGRAHIKDPTPLRFWVIDYVMSDPAVTAALQQAKIANPSTPRPLPQAMVTSSSGKTDLVSVVENPETGGWRLTFRLDPGDAKMIELRAVLAFKDGTPAETWVYRWTA